MKSTKILSLSIAACLLLCAIRPVNAQTVYTWNGTGGNGSWSNSNNWSGGAAPTGLLGGNEAIHLAGTTQTSTTVDVNSPWYVQSLNFDVGVGNFTVSGNPISISGATAVTAAVNGTFTQTIASNLLFAGSGTQALSSGSQAGGNLYVSGNITSNNQVQFTGNGANSVFTGNVAGTSGSTTAYKNGSGTWVLAGTGNNLSYLTLSEGTIKLGANNALTSGTWLNIGASWTTAQSLDMNGYSQKLGGLTSSGKTTNSNLLTNSATALSTLTYSRNSAQAFAGKIAGNIAFVKEGTGTFELSGTGNTYTGGTLVSTGSLVVTGDSAGTGIMTVQNGAALTLNPTAALSNAIEVQAGGLLTLSTNLSLSGTSILTLDNATTSLVNLNFTGNDTIGELIINGAHIGIGTYSAADLGSNFSGTGLLTVSVPEPSTWALLTVSIFVGLLYMRPSILQKRS